MITAFYYIGCNRHLFLLCDHTVAGLLQCGYFEYRQIGIRGQALDFYEYDKVWLTIVQNG